MQNVPKRKPTWAEKIGTVSGLADILTRVIPEPEPVLAPWLAAGEIALLHAPSGAGKTLVAQTLALAAATGADVLHSKGAGVPVLYIDGEMGEAVFQDRMRSIHKGLEVETKDAPFQLMQASACPPKQVTIFPYLDSERGPDRIKRYVAEHGIKLVVLDNLRFLARALDENAAESFTDVNRFLMELAAMKTAVLVIHHNNKGGNSGTYSGSTAIESPVSVRVAITKTRPSKSGNAAIEVNVEKNRRGIECVFTTGFSAELDKETGKWTTELGNTEAALLDFKERSENGHFVTQAEAAEAYGVDDRTIRRWIKDLKVLHGWDDDSWRVFTGRGKELRAARVDGWEGEDFDNPEDTTEDSEMY